MAGDAEQLANGISLISGDCVAALPMLDADSFDACVTDPPYHLTSQVATVRSAFPGRYAGTNGASVGFMGKSWDGGDVAFQVETWEQVYRVLKPGAHLLAFGGTRTYHRMACAIEDAGFEIRDMISWLYGSGFPKSLDVSKAIDKAAGVNGSFGEHKSERHAQPRHYADGMERPCHSEEGAVDRNGREYIAATDAARQWSGFGSALKPACEMIVLARKPLSEMTVAANVLKWGTGAINIDKCRVEVTGQRLYDGAWENDQRLCDSCAAPAVHNERPSTPETKASTATKPVAQILSAKDDLSQADIFKTAIGCSDGMRAEDTSTSLNTERSGNGTTDQYPSDLKSITLTATSKTTSQTTCNSCGRPITSASTNASMQRGASGSTQKPQEQRRVAGRWPSNVIHDGSDEVVAAFPDADGGNFPQGGKRSADADSVYGTFAGNSQNARAMGDSGSAARFFYQARPNEIEQVVVTWISGSEPHQATLLVDTGQLPGRAIVASASMGGNGWSTFLSGSTLTVLFQQASTCIIRTGTNSTTGSRIWNFLTSLLISDFTGAVKYETENGGNHAENVERGTRSLIITLAKMVSLPGAGLAASGTQLTISVSAATEERINKTKRFWYGSKANADDRLGAFHPTVKPLDLMQYLVRLITPPRGLVLDPFAGTGTTGEAAFREGFRAVLIEREKEYQNDIRRRMKLLLAGSDERAHATIKEKMKDKPIDAGPLFDWLAANSEAAK